MIDSHCHLTDPRLLTQVDAVLERAAAAGVTAMVTIGTDLADARAALALCRKYPDRLRCAVGIHPNHCQDAPIGDVDAIADLAADPLVVAVGETGLDYHYDRANRSRQHKFFEAQLAVAARLNKPVVVHSRESVEDALAVLGHFATVRCVFHCFTGTTVEADALVEANCHVGFTGPITFKKNDDLRRVVDAVPLDRLLVETDAPYLSPEPLRGEKTCEPAFVRHTLAAVAAVKGRDVAEVDRITAQTTRTFFGMSLG
jgi:TatD DNase family protein